MSGRDRRNAQLQAGPEIFRQFQEIAADPAQGRPTDPARRPSALAGAARRRNTVMAGATRGTGSHGYQ